MKKYIGAAIGVLFFVGLILLASNRTSSDSEISLFYDESLYGYNRYPSMNITAYTLSNWTRNYGNYSQYTGYYVYVKDAIVKSVQLNPQSGSRSYSVKISIVYDAQGNSTYSNYSKSTANCRYAEAVITGPKGYISVYNMNDLSTLSVYDIAEFLRLYCIYVVQPKLDTAYYTNAMSSIGIYDYNIFSSCNLSRPSHYNYSYSNPDYYSLNYNYNYSGPSYYNYTNPNYNYNYSRGGYNYTNRTYYNSSNTSLPYFPRPLYGPSSLVLRLPSQNITWSNMSIYVYNATFYGNYTYSNNYTGRIYAKYNVNAKVFDGYNYGYTYRYLYFYAQDVIYDAYSATECQEYYNQSLILSNYANLREILWSYYWNYAQPTILSEIRKIPIPTEPYTPNGPLVPTPLPPSTPITTNATYYLPNAYLRGENLTNWYHTSWWTYSNYTLVGYRVNIRSANFTGSVEKSIISGKIRLTFDAYGNNSYSPSDSQVRIWERNVGATISVYNYYIFSIIFDRQLAIYPSDIRNFLRAWVNFTAIPYLLNASSNATGIVFPKWNITGWDLNKWLNYDYSNYTYMGYYVQVYNSTPMLQQYGNYVSGWVNISFNAFGYDNAYACTGRNCKTITVRSNTTMYVSVSGDQPNTSVPVFYVDPRLRVNPADVENFLRGYYYGIMIPNITSYYKLAAKNQTIYLPNYYNDTQVTIDCSRQTWYCSGANSQSYLYFTKAQGYNLSITVNNNGDGYFNGRLNLSYIANLVNYTSTYYGKETIIDNFQGNAGLYLWGWVNGTSANGYYVTLTSNAYASVIYDRNNFVTNAAQRLYAERFRWQLQRFVNDNLPYGNRYYVNATAFLDY